MTTRKKTPAAKAANDAANDLTQGAEALPADEIVDPEAEQDMRFAAWMETFMALADDFASASTEEKEHARMCLFRHGLKAGQTNQAPFMGSAGASNQFDEARETKAFYDWQFKVGDVTPLRAWLERGRNAYRPLPMRFVAIAKNTGKSVSEIAGRGMAEALMQFRRSDAPERHQRVTMRPKGRG